MRISVTCIIALSMLALGARSARAEEPIACTLELRLADVVALRSDGVIGVGNRTITDDKISYDWSSLEDYNADKECNPYFNVGPDLIAMCQEFLAANAPDECPAELENTKKTVINQSKQIRRLARDNKRLRDLLKRPRPVGEAWKIAKVDPYRPPKPVQKKPKKPVSSPNSSNCARSKARC